jgi:hypothetical protein
MKLHTIAPQGRVSPSEGQNKAKLGKLQSPRSIIPTKNKEFVNQQALHPVPLNKSSDFKTFMALPHAESSVVAPVDVPQPAPKIGFFEGVSVVFIHIYSLCNVHGHVIKLCMTKL